MGTIPYESLGYLLYFLNYKNDMHASAALQKLYIDCMALNYHLENINLFDGFFKIG